MTTTIQSFGLEETPQVIHETDLESTAIRDLTGGVAAALKAIDLDNSGVAAVSYFKGYDNGSPIVGTTDPDLIIMIQASVRRTIIFIEGFDFDVFSMACVTTAGTAGVTNPTASVVVDVVTGAQSSS